MGAPPLESAIYRPWAIRGGEGALRHAYGFLNTARVQAGQAALASLTAAAEEAQRAGEERHRAALAAQVPGLFLLLQM
jgi:hypothetical protein